MDEQTNQPQSSSNPFVLTHQQKAYAVAATCFHHHILPLLNFQEVKRLREVCWAWELFVACYPRFQKCVLKIGREWHDSHTKPKNQEGTSLVCLGPRTGIVLQGSPFLRGPYFAKVYWPAGGPNVTQLTLVRMKLGCEELRGLIQICSKLTHLTFERVTFSFRLRDQVRGITGARQKRVCLHEPEHQISWDEPYTPLEGTSGVQSLVFITVVLPPCTMNYLGSRVQGSLKTLKCLFKGSRMNHISVQRRSSREPFDEFLRWTDKLIRANPRTIKDLYLNDRPIFFPFTPVIGARRTPPLPMLPALKEFGGQLYITDLEIGDHEDFRPPPQLQQLTHLTLHVSWIGGELDWRALIDLLFQIPTLQSIKIRAIKIEEILRDEAPHPAWETHLPHLKTLAIYGRGWIKQLDTTFLTTLPPGIQSLRTNMSIPQVDLRGLILRPNNLKTLCLDRGNPRINNELFQILIGSCPQLEVLRVKSTKLSDPGLTGIGLGGGPGRNLGGLTRLHSLDLSGCKSIGDPSVLLAIRGLTKLTFLSLSDTKVTEDGLISFLSQSVFPLEELQLFRVKDLTMDGINRILKAKGILKILLISKDLLKVNPVTQEDSNWKRVVKYKRNLSQLFSAYADKLL